MRVLVTSKISGKATNTRIVHIQRTKDLFKTRIIYLRSYSEGRQITFTAVSRYHFLTRKSNKRLKFKVLESP